jgi:hypothetical protein
MRRLKNKQDPLSEMQMRRALRKHINTYQVNTLDRLTAGRDHWAWHARGGRLDFVSKQVTPLGLDRRTLDNLVADTQGTQAVAFVLDGRWVAKCPDCNGQEVVDPDEAIFVCLNPRCLNQLNDGFPRRVRFPGVERMLQIEETLLARPNPINRNWLIDEDIVQLKSENTEHGLPERVELVEVNNGLGNTNNTLNR